MAAQNPPLRIARPDLARDHADALLGQRFPRNASNGLFLAAPRRTGKTWYLRGDLQPELARRGCVVVYADLWSDRRKPPGELLAEAIAGAFEAELGWVAKTARKAGMRQLEFSGGGAKVALDLSALGKPEGATLPGLFRQLAQHAGKPIALIVDEAQHALTSDEGANLMFALKAARDQLNGQGEAKLLLVMSGSHRDKLEKLLDNPAAPFYGSSVDPLPPLGRPYVEAMAKKLIEREPQLAPEVGIEAWVEAFDHCGHKPEFFERALGCALPVSGDGRSLTQRLLDAARKSRSLEREDWRQRYLALPALDRAIVWYLLEQRERFSPYSHAALAFYANKTDTRPTAAQVQKAIARLKDAEPPMLWKSWKDDYALYDTAVADWYAAWVAVGEWPPWALPSQAT